jgi:dynein heavy chain
MAKLITFAEQTRKYNSREQLFNKEQTDYSRLQVITKEFTPYNTLWHIVNKWYTDIDRWLNQPFEQLDANAAEKFVEESVRSLVGVIRIFKDKGLQQIVAVGDKVKA